MSKNPARVGIGYDVHPLVEGRKLILGGVEIEFEKGLSGHSDADVVTHAVCDALIGAAGKGDIGRWFPDTDPKYKNINSLSLLKETGAKLGQSGWIIGNIDCTVMAEKPRLAEIIPSMIKNLARTLGVAADSINIKATRGEGLGFIGRAEGVAAIAIASISKS